MSPTPQTTPIDGALVVPLTRHEDARGWFLEARKESWFRELGGKPSMQTNIVFSRKGVIRGLHFHELGQDDLFFCALGMVRVVLFDRREDSPTHGVAWSIDIGEDNPAARALYDSTGFSTVGRRPAYYRRKDNARADALVMRFVLASEVRPGG